MTRRDPRPRVPRRAPVLARTRLHALALLLAALAACPAQQRAPAQPDLAPGQPRAPAQPDRPPARPGLATAPEAVPETVIVAVADLAGDRDHQVKQRVLAHLRAFGAGPGARAGASAIEALDLPRPVLAPDPGDALSPLDALQEGHTRARVLLAESRAGALIWGTAGTAGAPVLYVTTAESSDRPCDRETAQSSEDTPPATGHVLCALDTGATFLLCATAWARIVPVGCAP